MKSSKSERGALLPMLALGLAVLLIMATVIVGVSREATKRAHAQAAADAVALAGAVGGEPEALRLVGKYDAILSEFTIDGRQVRVVLVVGGVTVKSQAQRQLVATGGG